MICIFAISGVDSATSSDDGGFYAFLAEVQMLAQSVIITSMHLSEALGDGVSIVPEFWGGFTVL